MNRKKLYSAYLLLLVSSQIEVRALSLSEVAYWFLGKKSNQLAINTMVNDVVIRLQKGSITDLANIDAIVNAANPDLVPGGGLCGAMYASAGPGLAQEIAQRKKDGTLPLYLEPGKAVRTGAHTLTIDKNIKYIIHAVGPNFSQDPKALVSVVGDAYMSSLACAEAAQCVSIAVPPLSAGIYRGTKSLEELAHETFSRLKKYAECSATLAKIKEIIVVVYSPAELLAYQKGFDEVFRKNNEQS